MTDTSLITTSEPATGFGRISLRTLVPIRWVAITGQALTILIVHYGLDYRLPLVPALAVVAGSVLLNAILILLRQAAARLGERDAALCLGYDILQLAILLYLTGGLQNPFSTLILAPVTVAATILSRRPVIALSVLAVAAMAALCLQAGWGVLLILLGIVYVVEVLSVIIQVSYFKATGGRRVFKMTPLHHHFELLGWAETTIVIRFWLVSGLFIGLGLVIFYVQWTSPG